MRYARIEENAMDHPKFIALNAGAWRLWCEGNTYCQKHLTNGFIPASAVKGFRYYSAGAQKQLLEAMVPNKGPLWDRTDGGFLMHDYLDWNDSAEKVLKARQDGKDRLERWRTEQAKKRGVTPPPETRFATQRDVPSKRNGTEQNNPPERSPEGKGSDTRASRGIGSGVMAGSLPRDHRGHAFCGRKCVPDFLHGEFVSSVGGADPDATVRQFYADVMDGIPADQPIGEEPLKFWRAQFSARFGSVTAVNPRTAGNVSAAARFVARRQG